MGKCSAIGNWSKRPCARKGKFLFIGEERSELRCPDHAYEWLGGHPPDWVESVTVKGVNKAVHHVVAA